MSSRQTRLERALGRGLIDKVDRDHQEPDERFRRRRIVIAIVLVIGAVLLGFSLAARPGDTIFYPLRFALAVTWAVGGFASGPLHLGYIPFRGAMRRPILTGLLLGLAAAAVFVAGALVVRQIPPLHDYVENVRTPAPGSATTIPSTADPDPPSSRQRLGRLVTSRRPLLPR